MMKCKFVVLLLVGFLGGCATSFTPYYLDLKPKYQKIYNEPNSLMVVVQDQRPYVLSGKKTENFYGLNRNGYGIPFSIDGPISAAEDIAWVSQLLLESDVGFKVGKKSVAIKADGLVEAKNLTSTGKVLFLKVSEWKTDMPTYGRGAMHYNIDAFVFDESGNELASKSIGGKDVMTSPDPEKEDQLVNGRWFQKARADVIGKILLDESIIKAIKSAGRKVVVSKPDVVDVKADELVKPTEDAKKVNMCTTDQIIAMKNAKMSDEQIRVACN